MKVYAIQLIEKFSSTKLEKMLEFGAVDET